MKHLFIGGPRDGQWMEIPDGMEMVQVNGYFPPPERYAEVRIAIETYRLVRWRYACGGKERKDVECNAFVHESVVNPVEALIAGYRPGLSLAAKLDWVTSHDPSVRSVMLAAVPDDAKEAREKVTRWHHVAYRREGIVTIVLPAEVAP